MPEWESAQRVLHCEQLLAPIPFPLCVPDLNVQHKSSWSSILRLSNLFATHTYVHSLIITPRTVRYYPPTTTDGAMHIPRWMDCGRVDMCELCGSKNGHKIDLENGIKFAQPFI